MKKYIPHIFMALLIIGFSFMTTIKAFSQTGQPGTKIDTTGSITTTPDEYSPVTGITPGRAQSIVAAVAGLISLIFGWRAKLRSAKGIDSKQTGAIVALALGLIGIILSIVHLSSSAGAVFGSGSGKAGAIVALMLGLVGGIFGMLALRQKKI